MQRVYKHFFNSPSKLAKENLFYIESVGHYWCDKSFFEDSYYTKNYYIIYIVSGYGYVCSDNEKQQVGPNQLIFLDLSKPYKYYAQKNKPWEFIWILFGGKDAQWYYEAINNKLKTVFSLDDKTQIAELLAKIYDLYEKKDPFLEIRSSNYINCMLTELYIESLKGTDSAANEEIEYPNVVKVVMDFIEQNYFRKISLAELSTVTYLSPYHLLRQFKKFTGYTPLEYTNKYRLDLSKMLLIEPELTIEQIALSVGFYTHSYFSKLFKKSTGLTPEKFRALYMRK